MAKFKVPKIVRPIELSAYASEFEGAQIWMWVNPPRSVIIESQVLRGDLIEVLEDRTELPEDADEEQTTQLAERMDEANTMMLVWWAKMFSQARNEDTHWTEEELRELATESVDTDPELWAWIQKTGYQLMIDHRQNQKKVLNGR